ncbi:hypothetical protein AB0H97_36205 [Streptomyces sp. NPDC050788]|jgi:hypothetical protein|uniref:hypothetical protein n=1 Tax=Streptomyces sp. NPDC050788 TaxID=3155041 RepID=UPI00342692EB
MPEREAEIIESGRAWMAGKVPSDEYFSKVVDSTAVTPGEELLNRLRVLVAAVASWWRR